MKPTYQRVLVGLISGWGAVAASSQTIYNIDPYGAGTRSIPDLANGGNVELSESQVIDVVILGDGFLAADEPTFVSESYQWYDGLFDPAVGVAPYNTLAQAFRVRAVFIESTQHMSGPNGERRQSHFRTRAILECDVDAVNDCAVCDPNCPTCSSCEACHDCAQRGYDCAGSPDTLSGWHNAVDDPGSTANEDFRTRLFDAIDVLDPPVNDNAYPNDLERPHPFSNDCFDPELFLPELKGVYSNVFVVMLVRIERCPNGAVIGTASGGRILVCSEAGCPTQSRKVRVAIAESYPHEFTHAFGDDVFDEYLWSSHHDTVIGFLPYERSVFYLSNLSFSDSRCDMPWNHLAPGGAYNPDVFSPVGRLYRGGFCEFGAWHAEYICLMNGGHSNYDCDIDPDDDGYGLRTCQLCFWCQEVIAVRIFEKAGQFARPGDPSDVNELGRTWYAGWEDSLRGAYFARFGIADQIREKNECYAACRGSECSCPSACSDYPIAFPSCLIGCPIVEYGNAVYVDGAGGSASGSGRRREPVDSIERGIALANSVCSSPGLVAIKPASYLGSHTFAEPAILVPEGCASVVIGR